MSDLGADRNVGLLMRQAQALMQRIIDQKAAPLGLTANQWRPLLLVRHKGINTPAGIARALGIDTGAVTRTLDRLEAKGFIQRARIPEDRRVVRIVLTDTGYQATTQILPVIAETLNLHLRGFSQAEIQLLISLLKRMIVNGEHYIGQTAANRT